MLMNFTFMSFTPKYANIGIQDIIYVYSIVYTYTIIGMHTFKNMIWNINRIQVRLSGVHGAQLMPLPPPSPRSLSWRHYGSDGFQRALNCRPLCQRGQLTTELSFVVIYSPFYVYIMYKYIYIVFMYIYVIFSLRWQFGLKLTLRCSFVYIVAQCIVDPLKFKCIEVLLFPVCLLFFFRTL